MNQQDKEQIARVPQPSESGEESSTSNPLDMFNSIPPEMKGVVSQSLGLFMQGSDASPFFSKLTSEHIGKIIDNADKANFRELEESRGQRQHNLLILLTVLSFTTFLVVFLVWMKVPTEVITAIIGFIAGAGGGFVGGFGIGRSNR